MYLLLDRHYQPLICRADTLFDSPATDQVLGITDDKNWSSGVLKWWVTGYTLRVLTFWILDCGFGIEISFTIQIPHSAIRNE